MQSPSTAPTPASPLPLSTGSLQVTVRIVRALARQLDLMVALALMITMANLSLLLSSPTLTSGISFLDHSWAFDLVVKAKQHDWLGGRVIFTYGPLFQIGSSVLPRLLGGSLGAYLRAAYVFHFLTGIFLVFVSTRILLNAHPVWKRALYILVFVVFWAVLEVRFCFDLFMFAVCLGQLDKVRKLRTAVVWRSLALALLILSGFTISADTGFYATAAFLTCAATHLWFARADRPALLALGRGIASTAILFAALALLLSALLRHPAGSGFLSSCVEIMSQYRWCMAAWMEKPVKWRLITATAISMLILLLGYRWRQPYASSLCRQPAFFPAAIIFSFLMLQSAVVRPDWGHVSAALVPFIALAGAVLMGGEAGPVWKVRDDLPLVVAVVLTAVFSGPTPVLMPQRVIPSFYQASGTRSQNCPDGTFYLSETCLPGSDYRRLKTLSEYLRDHTATNESIAIFPYENIYADLAPRIVAGGVLQNYMVVGPKLVQRQIDGLEHDKPRVAIFSADEVASYAVDGVPNFTRTPDVWFYLQSRFKKQMEPVPGIAVLIREEGRLVRWSKESMRLGGPLQARIRLKTSIPISLMKVPENTDFLKLHVTVHYPLWWRLRKPSTLFLTAKFADDTKRTFRVLVQPNRPYDIWIYPWNQAQLMNYFEAREDAWRKDRSPNSITALELAFELTDWLSVIPSTIDIHSVEAIRVRLK